MNNKLDGMSMDIEKSNLDKLKSVFPDCVVEGKLDIDKLMSLCGEYVDNDFEKYKFEWKGKAESLRLAQKRSTGTLRPCKEESVDFDNTKNLYIEGDNLEVLKLLQTAYYRKVKMIYIDPPYNTGNDFVYEDDFADPMAKYKEITGQATKSNPETAGRYHTNWLNMMYPRLRLASNLLTDDGVIFISIDDNEVDNLKKICNEVFGEENFVAQLVWQRAFSPKNDAKYVSNSHDYILMFAKKIDEFKIGRLERTEEANARYNNPDNDLRGDWTSSDMSVKTYSASMDYPITLPSGRIVNPPSGRCWRTSKDSFDNLVKENRVYFGPEGDNTPRIKRFLTELKYEGMTPTSLLFHKDVGHSQEGSQETSNLLNAGVFDGPKPLRLMSRLLTLANLKDDSYVLDFFSGSATTANAVMLMNSVNQSQIKSILVQLPEATDDKAQKFGYGNICEIGKERIRRAGAKIKADSPLTTMELDTGFKVFKLDTSNLTEWDGQVIQGDDLIELTERMNKMVEGVKNDRTELDVITEIMLKMGIPLDMDISQVEINGKIAYVVGDYLLLICLANNVTAEDISTMCDLSPAKLIVAESSFADSVVLSNAYYILKDKQIDMELV